MKIFTILLEAASSHASCIRATVFVQGALNGGLDHHDLLMSQLRGTGILALVRYRYHLLSLWTAPRK